MVATRHFAWLIALTLLLSTGAGAQAAPEALTLEQAVGIALERNPALRAAGENANAARAQVGMVRAATLPQINFSQGFTRSDNPVYVFGTLLTQNRFTSANFDVDFLNFPPPTNNWQTRLDAQFSLFDFRNFLRVGGAKKMQSAAEFQTEQERQDLLLRVVRAYYGVMVARENVQAAREALKTAEANEKRVGDMATAGTVVQSDLLSAQVFRGQMQERVIRAENQVELARMMLGHELGLGPEAREVSGTLGEPAQPQEAAEEYERAALAERPALRAAEMQRAAADKNQKSAVAEFAPRLGAFASVERDAVDLGGPSGKNWTVGARLELNVFSGGAKWYGLQEAKARERQAEDQLEWFRSAVRLEVRQAWLESQAARQRAEVARLTVEQAKESLRIIQNRHQAGLAPMTDLLRAQTSHLEARTGHLAALHDWQVARAQLERAAGRLTRDSEVIRGGSR